jgi:hypothetical protein
VFKLGYAIGHTRVSSAQVSLDNVDCARDTTTLVLFPFALFIYLFSSNIPFVRAFPDLLVRFGLIGFRDKAYMGKAFFFSSRK